MSSGRFFEGLFVGGLLGFLAGLLYAPKSGAELRRQLSDSSDELYRKASTQISDIKDRTDTALTEMQHKGEGAIKTAAAQVQETRDQITAKLQDLTGAPKVSLKDTEFTN